MSVNRLEALTSRYFTPLLIHRNVRYTAYALGILSVSAISLKIGTLPLPLTVVPATLFVLYQKNKDVLTDQKLAEKSARLAYHCFVIAGIWGTLLSGTTLTLGIEGGKLLLRGAPSFNPLEVLTALNSLACIGWFWAPLSFYLLSKSDGILYHNAENPLKAKIENFLKSLQQDLKSLPALQPPVALANLFFSSAYKSYLPQQFSPPLTTLEENIISTLKHSVPPSPQLADDLDSLKTTAQELLQEYLIYRKTPAPTPATTQDKTKKIVSGIFHYSFTAFAAFLPLYMNPLPTVVGLGLGWFYPLDWQSVDMLKRWTIIPNLVDQTLSENCYYIWRQSALALGNVSSFALIAYPMAVKHGFLWAETARYYLR